MKPCFLKLFTLLTILLFILCSCGASTASGSIESSSAGAVVIKAGETSGSLYDLMVNLQDAGELEFSGSESDYGFFVESVNGEKAESSDNQFWAVYTTLSELDGVSYSSADFGTYDFNGITLFSASYGVSGLPAVKGELYALILESY